MIQLKTKTEDGFNVEIYQAKKNTVNQVGLLQTTVSYDHDGKLISTLTKAWDEQGFAIPDYVHSRFIDYIDSECEYDKGEIIQNNPDLWLQFLEDKSPYPAIRLKY